MPPVCALHTDDQGHLPPSSLVFPGGIASPARRHTNSPRRGYAVHAHDSDGSHGERGAQRATSEEEQEVWRKHIRRTRVQVNEVDEEHGEAQAAYEVRGEEVSGVRYSNDDAACMYSILS